MLADAKVLTSLATNPTFSEAQLRTMVAAHGSRIAANTVGNPSVVSVARGSARGHLIAVARPLVAGVALCVEVDQAADALRGLAGRGA